MKGKALGHPLSQLRKAHKMTLPEKKGASKRMKGAGAPNYAKIKAAVLDTIARLSGDKQAQIPMAGTLPEIMVALALVWLNLNFTSQISEVGGRRQVGGGVVDIIVYLGSVQVIIRVMGDYWHSRPERMYKDALQWTRLHMKGYRVVDLWEHDIYQAWVDGNLQQFVQAGVTNAQ